MAEPATRTSRGVFISYRRQDAASEASLLQWKLSEHFGVSRVFMDVDSIELGVDFNVAIQRALDVCAVLLAVIGSQWATVTDAAGKQRLLDPADTVRQEIEAGLARDIRVIPVLVDGTPMPQRQQLPDSLEPLTRRNALNLRGYPREADDLRRLVTAVSRTLGQGSRTHVSGPLPQDIEALGQAAMDARERGGYDGELRYLDQVIERDSNNADAFAFRGSAYYQIHLHHEALGDFNRALELDPNHTLALLLRGSTWRIIEQYDLAARDLNKLLKLHPSDPLAAEERKLLPWRYRFVR
jgi:tetratricopeptide (TPR) repeat protein